MTAEFEELYSGVIYDSLIFDLDYQKPFVVDLKIKNLTSQGTFCGKAFTCLGKKVSKTEEINDEVRIEMFNEFTEGCIQVIDTSSNNEVAHFGDISGKLARKFGAKCVVIDGLTRDLEILKKDDFPVFCKGVTPIDAYAKWQIVDYQCGITLPAMGGGFINVTPEDYIFCDGDGVLVIEGCLAEQVLELALKRKTNEEKVRDEISKTNDIKKLYDEVGRW